MQRLSNGTAKLVRQLNSHLYCVNWNRLSTNTFIVGSRLGTENDSLERSSCDAVDFRRLNVACLTLWHSKRLQVMNAV